MELYKEILAQILSSEHIEVTFPTMPVDAERIVEVQSYRVLQRIKAVIENDSLSDYDCIEEIVRLLEAVGSTGGTRHRV